VLAKINVDENQRLSSTYRVQGIPAVKAFRGGRVVDEFTGALPESQVRTWLKRVVPSEGDQIVGAAAALEASDPQAAAARYRVALGSDPTNAAALFGLGRLLVSQGEPEGVATLREIPANSPFYSRAQAWLTLANFLSQANGTTPTALAQRVAGDPGDLEARYQLAAHHTRAQRYDEAIPQLLAIVERNRAFHDDGARQALLAIFEALGNQSPLAQEGRRKLANALF
jgi:putative thioredoxin